MIINLPPFPTGAGALRHNGDTGKVQQQLQDMLLNTLSREEVCCKPCKSPLAVGSPIYIIQVFVLNAPQHINHQIRRAHPLSSQTTDPHHRHRNLDRSPIMSEGLTIDRLACS